jgi:hypothetical protein
MRRQSIASSSAKDTCRPRRLPDYGRSGVGQAPGKSRGRRASKRDRAVAGMSIYSKAWSSRKLGDRQTQRAHRNQGVGHAVFDHEHEVPDVALAFSLPVVGRGSPAACRKTFPGSHPTEDRNTYLALLLCDIVRSVKRRSPKDAQTRRNPSGLDSLRSAHFPADLWLVRSTVPILVSSGLSTRRGAFV